MMLYVLVIFAAILAWNFGFLAFTFSETAPSNKKIEVVNVPSNITTHHKVIPKISVPLQTLTISKVAKPAATVPKSTSSIPTVSAASKALSSKPTVFAPVSSANRGGFSPTRFANATVVPASHPFDMIYFRHAKDSVNHFGSKCKLILIGDTILPRMARNVTLMTEWTKLYSVINLATPGYRTENMINSLVNGKLLKNFTYPKPLVVVNAGISNVLVKDSVDSVVKGLEAVITLIKKSIPQATIVVIGVLPRGHVQSINIDIKAVNAKLAAKYNRANKNSSSDVNFIDLYHSFAFSNNTIKSGVYSYDSVHPNSYGFGLILNKLQPFLKALPVNDVAIQTETVKSMAYVNKLKVQDPSLASNKASNPATSTAPITSSKSPVSEIKPVRIAIPKGTATVSALPPKVTPANPSVSAAVAKPATTSSKTPAKPIITPSASSIKPIATASVKPILTASGKPLSPALAVKSSSTAPAKQAAQTVASTKPATATPTTAKPAVTAPTKVKVKSKI